MKLSNAALTYTGRKIHQTKIANRGPTANKAVMKQHMVFLPFVL
jgi:hypothetical protein